MHACPLIEWTRQLSNFNVIWVCRGGDGDWDRHAIDWSHGFAQMISLNPARSCGKSLNVRWTDRLSCLERADDAKAV